MLTFLLMPLIPPLILGYGVDKIVSAARDEDERRTSPFYVACLRCGGRVLKSEVKKRGGCYLCGWVPEVKDGEVVS